MSKKFMAAFVMGLAFAWAALADSISLSGANVEIHARSAASAETAASVTGPQAARIAAAITNEQDLAALRLYHYGSTEIHESPDAWFNFDPATGTITGFNWEAGRTNVVVPWAIGGVAVVTIGQSCFFGDPFPGDPGYPVATVLCPKTVTLVGPNAFNYCPELTSVSLPSATIIGISAFNSCSELTSISLPSATSIGDNEFSSCPNLVSVSYGQNAPVIDPGNQYALSPNVTNYVTNPHATGWGATFGGRPVVRLPLFTGTLTARDAVVSNAVFTGGVTLGGVERDTWPEDVDVSAKLDKSNGTAANLSVTGYIDLPQTAATNMVLRLYGSNEHIYVGEVFK